MGSLRALAFALILAPALAAAQPSAKDKQKASDLVKRAIAKSQAGDHADAVALYEQAYKIIPQPLLLSNIGSEYQQMKKPYEALKYFCKYIEADPNGSNMSYATAQARTLYIELGGVTQIDDKDLCKPIVKPKPEPKPKADPKPDPKPEPKSEPSTPTTPTTTTTGVGSEPAPPSDAPVSTGPTTKTSPMRYVGLGLAVVGAGIFGAGIYYGLEAKQISDEITNHDPMQPWPSNIKAREAEGERLEKRQIGSLIAGSLVAGAGIAIFMIAKPKTSTEQTVTVVPTASEDSVGVTALGRF